MRSLSRYSFPRAPCSLASLAYSRASAAMSFMATLLTTLSDLQEPSNDERGSGVHDDSGGTTRTRPSVPGIISRQRAGVAGMGKHVWWDLARSFRCKLLRHSRESRSNVRRIVPRVLDRVGRSAAADSAAYEPASLQDVPLDPLG